jgi:chromosome segregation ATPase
MENFKGEDAKPRIADSEIAKAINESNESIIYTEATLKEGLDVVREMIEELSADIGYLEHMEREKEFLDLQEEVIGKRENPKYSQEEIAKIKQKIEGANKEISEFQAKLDELLSQKIFFEEIREDFEKLQTEFRDTLLRVDNIRLN